MDNKQYVVVEKPEGVSYDDLCCLIQTAHQENRQHGIKVNTKITTGAILKEHLGDAMTFVAMHEDEVIGTLSCNIKSERIPFAGERKVAFLSFAAVLPEWSGKGVCTSLMSAVQKYAEALNMEALTLIVVEKNPARKIYEHYGFEPLNYLYRKASNQFSVEMIKWLNAPPVSAGIIKGRFWLKRVKVRCKAAIVKRGL